MSAKLELHRPERAFTRLEAWLRQQGFFAPGGEGLEADLYLGYGLSQSLRRDASAPPPEPCALPLLACAIREPRAVRQSRYVDYCDNDDAARDYAIGSWQRTWSPAEYAAAVEIDDLEDPGGFGLISRQAELTLYDPF